MIADNDAARASRYYYRSAPKTPDPFSYMLHSADSRRRATLAYVAPFLAFIVIMAVERVIPLPPQWLYLARFLIVTALIGALSWPYLSFRPSAPLASIAIGVAVFVIWVAPDVLFGDSYRHYWLLFWRGWMMRWLIDKDFLSVPLGKYVPSAFWIVVLLFASEHGSYWEVGLAAGIVYNWWIVRTRNLADCILAHGITNAILCAYVLATGQWQYWL
jgi:hypothetical protein